MRSNLFFNSILMLFSIDFYSHFLPFLKSGSVFLKNIPPDTDFLSSGVVFHLRA